MQVGSFNDVDKGSMHADKYQSDFFPERNKDMYLHKKYFTEGKCISIMFSKGNKLPCLLCQKPDPAAMLPECEELVLLPVASMLSKGFMIDY
jgi:hypothetical protein